MKYALLLCGLFFTFLAAAQPDSLFCAVLWEEVSPGQREDFLLRLSPEGNFDEDAGPNHGRAARNLLGRWEWNAERRELTLAVDGAMGKGLIARKYQIGRDYYLDYELLSLTTHEMRLRDKRSGEERSFRATSLDNYEPPHKRRLPKAPEKVFTLPQLPKRGGG